MIISKSQLINDKLEKLKRGLSAYAESKSIVSALERKIAEQNLAVHIEHTPYGSWFIPEKNNA